LVAVKILSTLCLAALTLAPLLRAAPLTTTDPTPLNTSERTIPTFAPVISKVAPSVVNIHASRIPVSNQNLAPYLQDPLLRRFFGNPRRPSRQRPESRSLGSGVIVTRDGYILTNHHVIDGADEISVSLHDNAGTHPAKLIGTDPQTDIAVIKIDVEDAPAITLADSDGVEVGDIALAIGNPFGIGQTVTMGIVSATARRGMGIVDYEDFIQTDASINPGNSGGALVDAKGRLIGINQSIVSNTGGNLGVGLAVPVNLAKHVLASLISDGTVRRGHLGVHLQSLTPELAKAFDLEKPVGALIGNVAPGSPAARAGIEPGDVILEFDSQPVEGADDLRLIVSKTKPDTEVEAVILRNGAKSSLTIRVGELGRALQGATRANSPFAGVSLEETTRANRTRFNLPPTLDGIVVTSTDPRFPNALQPGDVIVELNRRPVRSLEEFQTILQKSPTPRPLLLVWSRGTWNYLVVE
jgi:serine protease Do